MHDNFNLSRFLHANLISILIKKKSGGNISRAIPKLLAAFSFSLFYEGKENTRKRGNECHFALVFFGEGERFIFLTLRLKVEVVGNEFMLMISFMLLLYRAEKEWGDGIRGLALSAARYSLLRLEEGMKNIHLK